MLGTCAQWLEQQLQLYRINIDVIAVLPKPASRLMI